MFPNQQPILIIPAFNPDKKLIELLSIHKTLNAEQICIVVNDGSHRDTISIFNEAEQLGAIVLQHEKNQGKGAAIKTALCYYLAHFFAAKPGVVTADADGQHSVRDIMRISEALQNEPAKLHIGVRNTVKSGIPWRSRLGNRLTQFLFNMITQNNILDTQTGLRGIPNDLIKELITTNTTRYEFEFEMFFIAQKKRISIAQTPIETIYIDGNKSSHFNPLLDSLRIYFIFIRFCSVAIASFVLDFSFFSLFYYFSGHPGLSVIVARLFSVPFNFFMNKNISFKSQNSILFSAFSYIILAVIIVMSSLQLMLLIHHSTGLNIYYSKILAEFLTFVINFSMQYLFVFAHKKRKIRLT